MKTTVFFNGQFISKDEVRISPDDRGFLFADGVYEVVRSYDGKLFAMEPHMDRMRRGLGELEISGFDISDLNSIVPELLERNGLIEGDAAAYIQISRGAAISRTHHFPDPAISPTVYATVFRFVMKADPALGASAITVPDLRWTRCDIKSTSLLPNCLASQKAHEAGAFEAVFVRDGIALEGSHTSFFAVIDGEVRTVPNSNYILPGITRQAVLEMCAEADILNREHPLRASELNRASELFLAGTTTEVLSIVQLDGKQVGNGAPGPISKRLQELLAERTQ